MNIEVELPDLGVHGGDQATVVEWHYEEGDLVERDEVLLDVECESGMVEVPSPCDGVLIERIVEEDEIVRIGEVVALVESRAQDDIPDQAGE